MTYILHLYARALEALRNLHREIPAYAPVYSGRHRVEFQGKENKGGARRKAFRRY